MIPIPQYPGWYADWMEYHLRLFGIFTPDNQATLLAWWDKVAQLRTSFQELKAASLAVIDQSHALKKLADHFPALKQTILAERQVRQTRVEAEQRALGTKTLNELFPNGILAEFERRSNRL